MMQDFRGQGTCCHLEAIAQLLAATRISKGRSWHQTAASMHTFITVRIFIIAPLDDPRLLGSLFNKQSSHPETRLCLQRDRNDLGRARLDGFTNSFGSTGSRTDSRVLCWTCETNHSIATGESSRAIGIHSSKRRRARSLIETNSQKGGDLYARDTERDWQSVSLPGCSATNILMMKTMLQRVLRGFCVHRS